MKHGRWMKYLHIRVWLGFFVAVAIIVWLAVTSFVNNKELKKTARFVAQTNRVLYHSEEILSLTLNLETGQRGFALTGIENFLEPATESIRLLDDHLESLKQLISDNQSQLQRLNRLGKLIETKIQFVNLSIEARRLNGIDSAIVLNASMKGKNLMDAVRAEIKLIQSEENRLLEERTRQASQRVDDFNASFTGLLLATLAILLTVFYTIFLTLKKRTQAEQALREASMKIQDMYDNAPCGYHSLDAKGMFIEINQTWLRWLQYSRDEVVGKMTFDQILTPESAAEFVSSFSRFRKDGAVNDLLFEVVRKDGTTFVILMNAVAIFDADGQFEKSRSTVVDYTQQKKALEKIEQLNQELESFSYSVSHDLRAPLRSIDGYTQILLEDYARHLDDEGKRVLNVVVNNARRMAKLIDDLLDFSRVGRKEVAKSVVNSESVVRSVVSELVALEPQRSIDITIDPLDPCDADPNLLRQVWVNLISNAIKYSRKRDRAEIQISSAVHPGEVVYTIKDNGTGFDMEYSHKLFGVFQRLHRQQEFEGTGVGLAIVHRIVSRHGGRVWAEGEVGKGATFHFSLPNTLG